LKKILAFAMIAAAATLVGLRIHEAFQRHEAQNAKMAKKKSGVRVVSVSLGKAEVGRVREEILITGSLRPKEQVDVTAKGTGRVERILFQLGDRVAKGALIAELEDDELQQQVQRARASLSVVEASTRQRRAELDNAKALLARTGSLMKEGLIPKTDLEARQTAYEVVQAQLQLAEAQEKQAQAEINELEIRLAQTRVYAPMSGLVARRHIDVGALVSPTVPIVSLVNVSTLVTIANVPEREVSKLRVGNEATIEVDAYGEQKFRGRVARIAPVLDAATRSATVEVEIPNPEGSLRAEMFARVTLDLAAMRDAVLIPRDALVYRGTQPGVYVSENNRPVFRTIEAGRVIGDRVEVLGNLTAGTVIVTRGSTMIREGDQMKITGEPRSAKGGGDPPSGELRKPGPAKAEIAEATGH
jgi:RND family efflux transporter MFP subunit